MNANAITKRNFSAKQPLTLELIEKRVLLVLNLYDKIDGAKVDDFSLMHPQLDVVFRVWCVWKWLSCSCLSKEFVMISYD